MSQPPELVTLFRPVGPKELQLIRESGFRRFPPRLIGQPFFYPVLNLDYAKQIAREWNAPASGFGAVTSFKISANYLERYEIHTVGGSMHREYWIPAEELEALNNQIIGAIEVAAEFRQN
jgi:hypothetical protein